MEKLLKATSRTEFIVTLRLLGTASLIVGIITAAMDKSFGGWTPIFWFLLAFAGFFGVLCNELYRVIVLMEKKKNS